MGANFSGPGAYSVFLISEQCHHVIMPAGSGSVGKAPDSQ